MRISFRPSRTPSIQPDVEPARARPSLGMAVVTVAVLILTTVVFAKANSNTLSSRTKITTLSAVPESTTALHAQW